MAKGYTLSADDLRRVSRTVRKSEGDPVSTAGPKNEDKPTPRRPCLQFVPGTPRGFGKYNGSILLPPDGTIDPDGPLTLAELGTEHTPEADVVVIGCNRLEVGTESNVVDAGTVWDCEVIRHPTPTSKFLYVAFSGFKITDCEESV
ncbi:MAG: hypothetical protein QM754_00730 [Tepidisphaeraceae bacterium]